MNTSQTKTYEQLQNAVANTEADLDDEHAHFLRARARLSNAQDAYRAANKALLDYLRAVSLQIGG